MGTGAVPVPVPAAGRPGHTPPPRAAAGAGSHGCWGKDAWLHSGPPGLRGTACKTEMDRERERERDYISFSLATLASVLISLATLASV